MKMKEENNSKSAEQYILHANCSLYHRACFAVWQRWQVGKQTPQTVTFVSII